MYICKMKKPLGILLIFCLMIFGSVSSFTQDLRYGLEFSSFEVVQEKRTGLNLTPSKVFSFPNGFSLSFDLFFQSAPEYNFGYVFRIIGQNGKHLDFLATREKLTVVNSEDEVLAECLISEVSNYFSSFISFQSKFDIKNETLNISIGDNVFIHTISHLKDFKKVNIIFGKCDLLQFQTSDVPKMIIKDISISEIKGDVVYSWKLSKHVENGVYDELRTHFAKVENPKWLLDDYASWNKKTSFRTLKNPQIAYNSDKNEIAIADRRAFLVYNPLSNQYVGHNILSGFVHSNQPNQMIYNPLDSIYYSYSFLNTDGKDVAAFNFLSKSWSNDSISEYGCEFWHHNRFVSLEEECLYLFGGYGQHTYKNQVNKYSFKTGEWEKLQYQGEQINPRYLSGLGVIDENRLLLFGGYGSNSGLQFLSPKNYYDLYQINLPDLTVKKIWEMHPPQDQFVIANSMVVDTLNKCFYALCFPQNRYETSLFFAKFSLEKPEYEIISNSIPFYFNDILSYVDLFHNKEADELYAVTFSSHTADSLSTVSIYSLSYPPLSSKTSVYQLLVKNNTRNNFIPIVIITLLLISAIIGYTYFEKKKVGKKSNADVKEFDKLNMEEFKITKQIGNRNKKQAIYLFGGLRINDKNERDITGEFSPMLKQLFLIILLNSLSDEGKGISSTKLSETLWPNKTRESARNNRSVMISKIRQLFENMGYISIESYNLSWTIKLGDEIYCDYREALSLIKDMDIKSNRTKKDVMNLVSVVSFGELLPNLQIEWVDSFKASFANKLIDLLIDVSKQKELVFSPVELVSIADTLLIYDVLNDDGLKLKCCALVKMGKNGLAKATYNSFVKQYNLLFGTKYNYTFTQIIS